jgi:hypothetical protein
MTVKTTEMDKLMNILRGEKPQQGGQPTTNLNDDVEFSAHPHNFNPELPFY